MNRFTRSRVNHMLPRHRSVGQPARVVPAAAEWLVTIVSAASFTSIAAA
jgi:hypothetical protein